MAEVLLKILWGMLVKLFGLLTALVFRNALFTQTNNNTPQTSLPQRGAEWIGWGISVLVAGVTIFLVIRFRSELWDFLKQMVSGVFQMMRRLVLAKAAAIPTETHPEYTDSVELLETFSAHAGKKRRFSWNHRYRQYRRITDPTEKFRAGYALWMSALKHWKAEVPPNAVPAKLLELSSGIPDAVLTAHITEIYYRVRYGGHIPTRQELEEMDRLIRMVRKMLLTVHHRIPES